MADDDRQDDRKAWTTPRLIDVDADVQDVEGGGGFAPDGPAGFTDS